MEQDVITLFGVSFAGLPKITNFSIDFSENVKHSTMSILYIVTFNESCDGICIQIYVNSVYFSLLYE